MTTTALIPDSIDPIVGWRVWRFNDLLTGYAYPSVWQPRRRQEAVCQMARWHPSPDEACSCGIYCKRSLEDILAEFQIIDHCSIADPAGLVGPHILGVGEVYLWGKIIEATKGFRGEFAYPKSFWTLNPQSALDICLRYQIPVMEERYLCLLERQFKASELSRWKSLYHYRDRAGMIPAFRNMNMLPSIYGTDEYDNRYKMMVLESITYRHLYDRQPGVRTATAIQTLMESTSSAKPAEKKGETSHEDKP